MKKMIYLNSIKSMVFMLSMCVTLLLGATACSSEEFGIEVPEMKKEWTKQELLEQALSRAAEINRTPLPAKMTTIKDTVTIKCYATEEMIIHWGGEGINAEITTTIPPNSKLMYTHIYTDNLPSHFIYIEGSMDAYLDLNVDNNRLISLKVNASHVRSLYCQNNHLDSLDLTGASALRTLFADNNELSSLDVSASYILTDLRASYNRLKEIKLPKNGIEFYTLMLTGNRLKEIDLTSNRVLYCLLLEDNLITDLDLRGNPYLTDIYLNNLPLKTFNGTTVGEGDFSMYKGLISISLANTPFTSLCLPQNSSVVIIDISETSISTLDITTLNNLACLYASYSELTDLESGSNKLSKLSDVRIERTPLEKNKDKIENLTASLPTRKDGNIKPGTLYTYSEYLNSIYPDILGKNWIINP